jgi:periplasmic copper chaperone A
MRMLHHGSLWPRAAASILLLCPAWMAAATDGLAGSIQVGQAWSRPTPPVGATAAAYLAITNSGGKADRLLGASTPMAVSAEINETRHSQGVEQMRRLESLEIPAGQTLRLEPGALHIMLLDLVRPLRAGAQYPLTLNFRDAGAVTVQVQVREQP